MIRTKVLVVGGGPGGYVAAIRAGQLGLDTVLVEADRLGGTCLIRGCIPSKALIHAAGKFDDMRRAVGDGIIGITLREAPSIDLNRTMLWKEGIVDRLSGGVGVLLRKANVRVLEGWATFSDAKTCTVRTGEGEEMIRAEHVILANGSNPAALPGLEFGGPVISSTEALALDRVPERLLVVGAGYIGLELGTAFRKLGSEVTIIEALERILPNWDEPLTNPVRRWLERAGVTLHLGATVEMVERREGAAEATVRTEDGVILPVAADQVLVTVGRKPLTQGWGLGRWPLIWRAHSSASMNVAAPRCAMCGPSATLLASRCSRPRHRRRARWWRNSSVVPGGSLIPLPSRRCALRTPRSSASA